MYVYIAAVVRSFKRVVKNFLAFNRTEGETMNGKASFFFEVFV